jgi:hypothetical protein
MTQYRTLPVPTWRRLRLLPTCGRALPTPAWPLRCFSSREPSCPKHLPPDSSENYPLRISTTGRYEWRTDLYDDVAEQLGEQTRAGAIDASCEFTKNMLANLERAADHPNMTEELAEILSTPQVELEYEVRSEVRINGRD